MTLFELSADVIFLSLGFLYGERHRLYLFGRIFIHELERVVADVMGFAGLSLARGNLR